MKVSSAKILIVEDEYITARTISNFLEDSGYDVVGYAMDTVTALSMLKANQVDCVVLDININDEHDGIWIANYIKKHYNIPYLYLTAYNDKETVQRAINTSPYGFLEKPFQKASLYSAIEIALRKHEEQRKIKEEAVSNEGEESILLLKDVDKLDRVPVAEINFIESERNYLYIHTDKKVYKHRATIKQFIARLPEDDFAQTHRAFVVNLNKLKFVSRANSEIQIGDRVIIISKTFKKAFFEQLQSRYS